MNWPSASTATPAGLGTSPHSLRGALAEQRSTPSTFQDHGLECPNNPQTVGKVPRRPRASPDPAAEAFTRSCRTSEKCEHSVTTVSQLTFQVRASLGPVMSWYVSSWGTSRRRWPWRDAEEQASDTCTWTLAFASGLPAFSLAEPRAAEVQKPSIHNLPKGVEGSCAAWPISIRIFNYTTADACTES